MKQLEELEKKVLQIIRKNKEIKEENELLSLENEQLREKANQLENSLLTHNKDSEQLETEKTAIKSSIEDLLESLGSLEATSEKQTK